MLNVHFFGGFSKSFIILKMDEPLPNEGGEPPPNNGMKRELTVPKKNLIIKDLLLKLKYDEEGTQLQSGALSAAAKTFDKGWSSIRKIWILAKSNCENPEKERLLVVIVVW